MTRNFISHAASLCLKLKLHSSEFSITKVMENIFLKNLAETQCLLHQLFKGQSPAFWFRLCSIFILGQVLLWLVCASSQVPAFGSMKKQCFKRTNLKQLTDSGNLARKKKRSVFSKNSTACATCDG